MVLESIRIFGIINIHMNEKIKVSIPLEHGEVQRAHDIIKILASNQDLSSLKHSADYLYKKSQEANSKNEPRDAFILEDLGKLAMEVMADVKEQKEADK